VTVETGGPLQLKAWLKRQSEKEIPDWQVGLHKKLHFQVGNEMMERSPVGNIELWDIWWETGGNPPESLEGYTGGRFRGNWQSVLGRGSTRGEVRQAEKLKPRQIMAKGTAVLSALKPYSRSFWVNNVPYSIRLAEGWSTQAPDGWIDDSVDRIAAQFGRSL
jgi:hypothetical protein